MISKRGKYPNLDRTNKQVGYPAVPMNSAFAAVLRGSSKEGVTPARTATQTRSGAHIHARKGPKP
jgi:hypothetical protein